MLRTHGSVFPSYLPRADSKIKLHRTITFGKKKTHPGDTTTTTNKEKSLGLVIVVLVLVFYKHITFSFGVRGFGVRGFQNV